MRMYHKGLQWIFVFVFAISIHGFALAAGQSTVQHERPLPAAGQITTASREDSQVLVRDTKYGKVKGAARDEILLWTGIPYAAAPAGNLRWRAPQEPDAWEGIFDATKSGNKSIQNSSKGIIGSEDSLNLNIYRPRTDEKNLPVFFYIHGGNNQFGSNQDFAPDLLAKRANAVIVTVNTRLGILGFNNLPALKTGNKLEDSGNFVLLDLAKSLDWIKDNISSFGGNPGNITVSGFSSGGRDVMAMLISPLFEGKFQKAISFSGGMTTADPAVSQKVIAKTLAKFVVEDGIKPNEDEAYKWLQQKQQDVRDYLYGLSADRLASAFGNAGIRMSGFPHLYLDGVVLPKEGFQTAKYNSVPLVMLASADEFSFFAPSDPYFAKAKAAGTLLSNPETRRELEFAIRYGSRFYSLFNAEESAGKMFPFYHAPIYTCEIAWGNNPKIVGEEMAALSGATHGIFLPFLTDEPIGVRKTYAAAFDNPGAKDLTEKFQKYIANFLWTSNPNGRDLVTWKAWQNAAFGPTQLIFDADQDKAVIRQSYARTNYNDIIKALENDASIPEGAKNAIIRTVLNGRWFSSGLDAHFNNANLWLH